MRTRMQSTPPGPPIRTWRSSRFKPMTAGCSRWYRTTRRTTRTPSRSQPTILPSSAKKPKKRIGAENLDPPFLAMLSNGTSGDASCRDFTTPRREFDRFTVGRSRAMRPHPRPVVVPSEFSRPPRWPAGRVASCLSFRSKGAFSQPAHYSPGRCRPPSRSRPSMRMRLTWTIRRLIQADPAALRLSGGVEPPPPEPGVPEGAAAYKVGLGSGRGTERGASAPRASPSRTTHTSRAMAAPPERVRFPQ